MANENHNPPTYWKDTIFSISTPSVANLTDCVKCPHTQIRCVKELDTLNIVIHSFSTGRIS